MNKNLKKAVLILVEGPTDETVVKPGFEDFFLSKDIKVKIYPIRYDITLGNGHSYNKTYNIKNEITNKIKDFLSYSRLKKSDILEVIELIDIDGCYLADELIEEDSSASHITYSKDCIKTSNRESIIYRNELKRHNIDQLIHTDKVYLDIPYSIYFFSSNLENYFFNDYNCDVETKIDYSFKKFELYKENIANFYHDINQNKTKSANYLFSWDELKEIKDYIPRLSNLFIFFNK
jgi:hypothetical protein